MVTIGRILVLVVIIVAWELAGSWSSHFIFFFGTPSGITTEVLKLVRVESFHRHMFITASEAFIGLSIGTLLGAITGLVLWYSKLAADIARPFVLGLGTMPIIALAPIMIVWFGIDFGMKVALAGLSTVFVSFAQAYRGAQNVSVEYVGYVEVLEGMNASRHQMFFKVIVPGSLDSVFGAMKLNVGLGLLGAFIGEFISSQEGLGYLVLRAASLYNVPRVFAASIGIVILAIVFDWCAGKIEAHRDLIVQLLSVPRRIWR